MPFSAQTAKSGIFGLYQAKRKRVTKKVENLGKLWKKLISWESDEYKAKKLCFLTSAMAYSGGLGCFFSVEKHFSEDRIQKAEWGWSVLVWKVVASLPFSPQVIFQSPRRRSHSFFRARARGVWRLCRACRKIS